MAWVLPGSFLNSNYGIGMHATLTSRFGRVVAIRLGDRIFLSEGTEERTVLLLCSGYGQSSDRLEIGYCESIVDLAGSLYQDNQVGGFAGVAFPRIGDFEDQHEQSNFYRIFTQRSDVVDLGQLCKVLIGTVTGANWFFVISKSQAENKGITSECLRPILSKFGHLSGLELTTDDVTLLCEKDKRCLLFYVQNEEQTSDKAVAYMATFPEETRKKNRTFQRRQNRWLAADDGRIPDGFFSYMTHDGPRLVINDAKVNSTNSIHRVYFAENISPIIRKLVVISLCTTFSQLSAEIEGRSYGSGVLKIEPSEAKKIKLILPEGKMEEEINLVFTQMDLCFRSGEQDQARILADQFIFGDSEEVNNQAIGSLFAELIVYRNRRKRSKS